MNIRLRYSQLTRLPPNFTVTTFRNDYFSRERPVLLPREHFRELLPCIHKWFELPSGETSTTTSAQNNPNSDGPAPKLKKDYLSQYGNASIEIEATAVEINAGSNVKRFSRHAVPLDLFVKWSTAALSAAPDSTPGASGIGETRLYIAQSALESLPFQLQQDVPVPELVRSTGKGDVYGSSLWMGLAPTRTPLHRDPNPNLFVQLIGRKRVRVLEPIIGDAVFATVAHALGAGTGRGSDARLRNEEMMIGPEGEMLERIVWQDAVPGRENEADQTSSQMLEAIMESGDALFIPNGWWHAIRGEGHGINASVNWWFR